jgi:hypothetical protein
MSLEPVTAGPYNTWVDPSEPPEAAQADSLREVRLEFEPMDRHGTIIDYPPGEAFGDSS